jgi:hypothetical protein
LVCARFSGSIVVMWPSWSATPQRHGDGSMRRDMRHRSDAVGGLLLSMEARWLRSSLRWLPHELGVANVAGLCWLAWRGCEGHVTCARLEGRQGRSFDGRVRGVAAEDPLW